MAVLKFVLIALCAAVMVQAAPGGHSSHEHFKIHVPYKVHTVHHHHTKTVPVVKEVEVPVIKHVPVYKTVHVPVFKHIPYPVPVPVVHKVESHGWSGGSSGGFGHGGGFSSGGFSSGGHGWL